MAETKISVRSDLLKIVEDLKIIAQTADETGQSLSEATKQVGKNVDDQVAVVNGGMNKIRKFGKDLVSQLGSDFKALFSVNALVGGMKLSEQLAGSVKQAINLNDTIRNLAPVFGMNEAAAERFKRTLVKGLGEIGLGSDAAANALQGLAETPVRGEQALQAYAKTAGELASISKQKGQEAGIAKGLAGVVVAQGGNPNDPRAMQRVAEDIVRIRNATGKSATEALDTLNKLFSSANTDFKKKLLQGGGVSLAAAGLIGGQGSTAFLERYLGLSAQARAGYEAQGLGRLIGTNGQLNNGAFQSTIAEAKRRGSGNAEFGLQTMGMTEEEAKGFLRLANAIKTNGDAVDRARRSVVDINQEYQKTMSFGDAFRANLNRLKGGFADAMQKIGAPDLINKTTDILQGASHSMGGAAATVGGSAILAAMLAGGGLKGIGAGLLGGELKKKAIEGVTGEKVQRVEVINWPMGLQMGAAGSVAGAGGALGTAASVAGKVGLVGAAGAAGYAVGSYLNGVIDSKTQGTTEEGFQGSAVERLIFKIDKLFGGEDYKNFVKAQQFMTKDVNVHVRSADKSLKTYQPGSRGASQ